MGVPRTRCWAKLWVSSELKAPWKRSRFQVSSDAMKEAKESIAGAGSGSFFYSAKWKSVEPNSIQSNGNLFSQTGIYSVKRESIQPNAGVAGVRSSLLFGQIIT